MIVLHVKVESWYLCNYFLKHLPGFEDDGQPGRRMEGFCKTISFKSFKCALFQVLEAFYNIRGIPDELLI